MEAILSQNGIDYIMEAIIPKWRRLHHIYGGYYPKMTYVDYIMEAIDQNGDDMVYKYSNTIHIVTGVVISL